jgi:hypothetical protein
METSRRVVTIALVSVLGGLTGSASFLASRHGMKGSAGLRLAEAAEALAFAPLAHGRVKAGRPRRREPRAPRHPGLRV